MYRAPSYNPDADVPMTEADLSPLLSKPSPEGKKEKKEKKDKKDKSGKDKKDKKDKKSKDKKEEKDKDGKKKDGKKEKKRSRKEMEDEEDEIEDKVLDQTKSNGVEESAATKKEKSKFKKDVAVIPQSYAKLICRMVSTRNEKLQKPSGFHEV